MSKNSMVVWGMGEIGSVLARAFLRAGYPVLPVTRDIDFTELAADLPDPEMVVIAVGEAALPEVLEQCPQQWRGRLVLIQNELLPRDWSSVDNPTIMSVWFEKKKGQDVKIVVPSQIYGSHAETLKAALKSLDIPCEIPANETVLLFELVRKNLYILSSNLCGLRVGGNVGDLWDNHQAFLHQVGDEILMIQAALTGEVLDNTQLYAALKTAFDGDPQHGCMGRSAPARLQRAITLAKENGLNTPILAQLAQEHL